MSKEQYKGIHDIVNDQGFAMHYRAISNTVSHLEVFRCERINTAKQKDGLTSFLTLSVLETKIFQYGFLEEHKVCVHISFFSETSFFYNPFLSSGHFVCTQTKVFPGSN